LGRKKRADAFAGPPQGDAHREAIAFQRALLYNELTNAN